MIGSPIGFNRDFPTQILPQSRNPEGYLRHPASRVYFPNPEFCRLFSLKFREFRPSNGANPESRETSWGPSNEDIFLLDGAFRTTHQSLKSGGQGAWLEGKMADRGARGLLCTFKWIYLLSPGGGGTPHMKGGGMLVGNFELNP